MVKTASLYGNFCKTWNFDPLAAEILSLVWGTPGNFNGFRVLAEGATYIRQGGHHVGHSPTFVVEVEVDSVGGWKLPYPTDYASRR